MRSAKASLIAVVLFFVAFAIFVGWLIWPTRPDPGKFDQYAVQRIRALCGKRTDCQVRLRDLTQVDWDVLYEWESGYSESDVSHVIGSPFHSTGDFGRAVVLIRDGRMVYLGEGDEGVEGAIAGTVSLRCNNYSNTMTMCRSNALMQVSSFETDGDPARGTAWPGTSYVLRQIN